MGETSKDVLTLLTQLMPGFLTAWVVYGLTTYTKPPQFERVIQAVIYSFLVNARSGYPRVDASLCWKDRQIRPLGQVLRIGRIYGQSNFPVDKLDNGCDSRKSSRCTIKK